MTRSTALGRAMRSKENRAARRSLTLADALCCRDLSTLTRIWFLREIGLMILNGVRAAKVTSKSPKPVGEFGQPSKKRGRQAMTTCFYRQGSTQNGFCAVERQLWKENPATGSRWRTN